jgi:hypothetical protein
MCVTVHNATLGRTTIAGWRFPPRRTHCLLYANEPANRAGVPNAMILHIPLRPGDVLTEQNFLPTAGLTHVLDDMWEAAPKYEDRGPLRMPYGSALTKGVVTVFTMSAYTWVAATRADAGAIGAALGTVHTSRRPQISRGLIEFYLRTWPGDALAIGCFSRADGRATEPVGIEYRPQSWGLLRMPAVDAHGEIPDLRALVQVNHRLIAGTSELGLGGQVTYRERPTMNPRLAQLLPSRVVAAELPDVPMANGDFYIDFTGLSQDSARHGHLLRARGSELDGSASRIPVLLAA